MVKDGSPPRWIKYVNPVIMVLNRFGLAGKDSAVLTVPGRRSGTPRHTPVSVLAMDGQRYLLAGYPTAEWPRNVRAAGGTASLAVGRRTAQVRLVELEPSAAEPVLRAWPVRIPQGAKVMVDAGVVPDASPDTFAGLAGRCAVFRIDS